MELIAVILGLVVSYWVVRAAVRSGVVDAHERIEAKRAEAERAATAQRTHLDADGL